MAAGPNWLTPASSEIQFSEVILEKVRYALQHQVDPIYFEDVQTSVAALDYLGDSIAFQLKVGIWGERPYGTKTVTGTSTDTFAVYDSAWQLWKANHRDSKLFGWFVRRYPPVKNGTESHVLQGTVTVDGQRLYPQAALSSERYGQSTIRLSVVESNWSLYGA